MSTRVGGQSPYARIRIKGLLIAWAVWFSASPLILVRPSPAWLHPRQAGGLGLCVLRQSPSPSGHCGPRTHDSPTNAVTPASDCEPLARLQPAGLVLSQPAQRRPPRAGASPCECAHPSPAPWEAPVFHSIQSPRPGPCEILS